MKGMYIDALTGLTIFLETPDEEYEQVEKWLFSQAMSYDEFMDNEFLAGEYEAYKVSQTAEENLPLLVEDLKTKKGKDALQKRLEE